MKFDPFGLSVNDLCKRNVFTRCISSGPLYMMRLPSQLAPSLPASAPLALDASASTWHQRLGHPMSMSYPKYLMILVLFALGALITFAMLAI
jgi:hypothetical protein